MTQPEEAVGGEPIVDSQPTPEDRLNAAFADPANHQEDDLPVEGEELPEDELTETDLEEEADDLPPIAAPVSWDAEAKAVFADLPRKAQEIVQKREAEREGFVQQKSQEAARARQDVEQEAHQSLAQYDQQVSERYHQVAQVLEQLSAEPDYALLATDPAEFARQAAIAKHYRAQFENAQRGAQQHAQQAQERTEYAERAHLAEQHRIIVENFPEYANPTTGPKLQQELSAVARELGYPPELISQARAPDILAMRTAAGWKAKADRLDRLEAKKMEKVRAHKGLPKTARPGTAQAPGAARQQQYSADRTAMRSGDKDATQRVIDSFFQPK